MLLVKFLRNGLAQKGFFNAGNVHFFFRFFSRLVSLSVLCFHYFSASFLLLLSCSVWSCERNHTAPVSVNIASMIIVANFALMPDKCDPELAAAFFSKIAVAVGLCEDEDEDDN